MRRWEKGLGAESGEGVAGGVLDERGGRDREKKKGERLGVDSGKEGLGEREGLRKGR